MRFQSLTIAVIIIFLLVSCFGISFIPKAIATNGSGDNGGGDPTDILPTDPEQKIYNPLETNSIQDVVANIINVAYGLAAIVALIYLIIGGYQLIISSGNPDVQEQAKSTITNAIIGLVVILISYLIIHFVLRGIGAPGLIPTYPGGGLPGGTS